MGKNRIYAKKRTLEPPNTNISYQCIWNVHLPCVKASLHYYYYYYYYYSLWYLVCIAGNKYKWVFQKWNSHSCECTFFETLAFAKGKIMQPPTTLQDFDIMFMRLPYPYENVCSNGGGALHKRVLQSSKLTHRFPNRWQKSSTAISTKGM